MDAQSKNILKHLMERLDKMDNQQYKFDRVMERLDTLQHILERQNLKQNLLDQMLVEMTVKLQKDTVVTREQGAQEEISKSFQVIDHQRESALLPHHTTKSLQSWDNINDRLKSIEDRTIDTSQKCHQLTSWSRIIEDKMVDLATNSAEIIKTFLVEIRSVKDLIKGQTNTELIWLTNQIDKKLSDIGSVVTDIYQQQLDEHLNSSILDVPREVRKSLDSILTTHKQSIIDLEDTVSNLISGMNDNNKEQSHLIIETLKSDLNKLFKVTQPDLQTTDKTAITKSETQTIRIEGAAENDLKHLIQTEGNISKFVVQLGNIHGLFNSLLESIQGNMPAVTKIDITQASMINTHTKVNKTFEELTTDLKDYISEAKREIFAVTEKEAQIVRDQMQRPLQSPGNYTFDFYVNDFKTLVRSGKWVCSSPWHINELQTRVTGCVIMSTDGEIGVWLMFGRHPHEVGSKPRSCQSFNVKATICDICETKLPPVYVGEVSWSLNEAEINSNCGKGYKFGTSSCDVLLDGGYGKQEGYYQGAVLIRYEVTIQ